MEVADQSPEQHPEHGTATGYWHELANDLVSLRGMPPSDPEYGRSYRLYVLAVLAAAEQDMLDGATESKTELLNRRFHGGIAAAMANQAGDDTELHSFAGQDLDARQWGELMAHHIAPRIRFTRRDARIPDSYLGILQALDAGDLTI